MYYLHEPTVSVYGFSSVYNLSLLRTILGAKEQALRALPVCNTRGAILLCCTLAPPSENSVTGVVQQGFPSSRHFYSFYNWEN